MRSGTESGQATVLVLGLAILCFAVAGIAVDGTRAFIYRRSLQNAADSAAQAGASEIDPRSYYKSAGSHVVIDSASAQAAAAHWLNLRNLPVDVEVAVDATGVVVRLRGSVDTSFLGLIGVTRLPVAVEARAEPIAGD